jgi:hypothetical protein
MFSCPYQGCEKTFSRRATLREHTKSHKGQAYWEILNEISNISNISNSSRVENVDDVEVEVVNFFTNYTFFVYQMVLYDCLIYYFFI